MTASFTQAPAHTSTPAPARRPLGNTGLLIAPLVLGGNVCALLAAKDHVNLFLYDGVIVPDPHHIITGGHENTTARTISFYREETIPRKALKTMLARICANNRAGGWRKVKALQERRKSSRDA